MSKKRIIKIAKSKIEKHETYVKLNERCEKALENGEYETVIMLNYSMIEDRLLSFLHYMYIIDRNSDKLIPTDYIDKIIRPLLKYKEDSKKGKVYKIYNISTKIKILKLFCKKYNDEQYLNDCYNIIEKNIGMNSYKIYFEDLKKWINIRNEIIHAAYNKDITDLNENARLCAKEGTRLARLINEYTEGIKKKEDQISIRDKYEALGIA